MKKILLFLCLFMLCLSLFSQKTLVETSQVINIEVPVRVFQSGRFVDDLKIKEEKNKQLYKQTFQNTDKNCSKHNLAYS